MNTMKNLKTIALITFVVLSTATITAQDKKPIDVSKSKINWVGKKITGQHEGTVNFKDGILLFKGKDLKGGRFAADMTTLTSTDLSGDYQQKLNGHLNGDDFFGTTKYPTAVLAFKKVVPKGDGVYTVTADLTIKDKTNPITFDLAIKGNTATTKFAVDRTKYDIKYGSGSFFDNLGDKTISDNFDLTVSLQF